MKHFQYLHLKQMFLIISLIICANFIHAQIPVKDSIENELLHSSDSIRLNLLLNLTMKNWSNQPDKALQYAYRAIRQAKSNHSDLGLAKAFNVCGIVYDFKSQNDSAIAYYNKAVKLAEKVHNIKLQAGILNNIGLIYWNIGFLDSASQSYMKAMKIFEQLLDTQDLGNVHNNIGLIYWELKEYETAKEEFKSALKYRLASGDEHGLGATYTNLGLIYSDLGYKDSALFYLRGSESIKKKINDRYGLIMVYNNIGTIYNDTKDLQNAKKSFLQSYKLSDSLGSSYYKASTLINISGLWSQSKDTARQIESLEQALVFADSAHSLKLMKKARHYMGLYYQNHGNINKAYNNLKQEVLIKDSLSQIGVEQQLTQLNNQFKIERYQAQLKYTALQQTNRERIKRLIMLGVIGLLLFSLVIVIVIYSRYRVKKKAELEKAYRDLDKIRFRSVIETQEKERKRIARELHDGIGQLLSTAKLNMASLEGHIPQSEPEEYRLYETSIKLIDDACTEVRNVSHNMMPIALTQKGLEGALKDLVLQYSNSNKLIINLKFFNLDSHLNEALEICLYRIVQESISNIVKHSSAHKADIQINQIGRSIHLLIRDDGKGFDTSIIKKAEGIGWNNIYSRVSLLNGIINVQSSKNNGTEVNIKIAA